MPAEDAFRVAIKDSASRVLEDDSLPRCDDPRVLEYQSRDTAEQSVNALDPAEAGSLEFQQPAPNDPHDVDAYLVFYPADRKRSPDGSPTDGWTFDTTANQYGAIGEALVTAPGTPALNHFVRHDLGTALDTDHTDTWSLDCVTDSADVDWDTLRAATEDGRPGWTPDCEVRVRLPDRRGYIHRYFCEIKTGAASFQRNQSADMAAVSEVADVLKIRVRIDELPDEYTVTFDRVGDSRPSVDVTLTDLSADASSPEQAGLSDFRD